MEIILNAKKIMKIIDGLKTQPTRKGDVGDWDYHDL
jgi:hypothetical protein